MLKTLINKKRTLVLIAVFCVFVFSFLISRFFFQILLIQGNSMEPTLSNFQFVVLGKMQDEFTYGDIVQFYCPELKCNVVKRIVACPGDTVQIVNGLLLVNEVESEWLRKGEKLEFAGIASDEIILAEGEYFVLGDNYAVSRDSRDASIGVVQRNSIAGKVLMH